MKNPKSPSHYAYKAQYNYNKLLSEEDISLNDDPHGNEFNDDEDNEDEEEEEEEDASNEYHDEEYQIEEKERKSNRDHRRRPLKMATENEVFNRFRYNTNHNLTQQSNTNKNSTRYTHINTSPVTTKPATNKPNLSYDETTFRHKRYVDDVVGDEKRKNDETSADTQASTSLIAFRS